MRKICVFDIINLTIFIILSLIMIYPIWYILMGSVSANSNIIAVNGNLWPNGFTLTVYEDLISDGRIFLGYRNSFFVTVCGTAIALLVTSMMAYPLSREFAGKRLVMVFVIFTMIFNGGLIATYLTLNAYGLINTLWALFLPTTVSVYDLLIMIRFLKAIPVDIYESAYLDGANELQIYAKIVLPLSKASIATIGLFTCVMLWNSFLPGLMYLNRSKMYPIQVILYNMIKASESAESNGSVMFEATKMATAFFAMLPILAVYPFIQKYFTKGVMLGSVKG